MKGKNMITITKIFEFAAGHCLPYHDGLCKNQHGHNFKLEVTVGKKIKHLSNEANHVNNFPSKGMVIDFKQLKNIVNEKVIKSLDHQYLNDQLPNPTAELLILHIRDLLISEFGLKVELIKIRLWESSTSYAEWKNRNI